MYTILNTSEKPSSDMCLLGARLTICAQRIGGKRQLCRATGMSEAQLFRYVKGQNDIPSERLAAIAKAANVDPAWLLTGKASDANSGHASALPFNPELLEDIVQQFQETIINHSVRFTPRQCAHAISLMYDALQHEKTALGQLITEKNMMLHMIDYLSQLRITDDIATYHTLFNKYDIDEHLSDSEGLLLERLITRATQASYNGASGRVYYDKMGYPLNNQTVNRLLNLVSVARLGQANPHKPIEWLDLGCGNGRHLVFLKQHVENIRLHGLDNSSLVQNIHEGLVKSGKLEADTFALGDLRNMPYADNSMDVVYWRQGLFLLPYLKGHSIGLQAAVREIRRVLKPGGVLQVISLHGDKRLWLPFAQQHNLETIRLVFEPEGMKMRFFEALEPASSMHERVQQAQLPRYTGLFAAMFIKL